MNNQSLPLEYANDLIFEIQKAFWDERGKGARFRMTTIGQEYFNAKVLPILESNEIEKILSAVANVLKREGIAADLSYSKEDRLLRVRIEGCIHRQVEARMIAKGIEPFTCVPANLLVLAIEKKLDIPVELAEIKVEEGICQLLLVLFEKRPVLD